MRLARKLFLAAAAATAIVAFAAPAANAVEVSTEAGVHCSEVDATNAHVVSGGCVVEAEAGDATLMTLRVHAPMGGEAVLSICEDTFTVALHESGDGFIYNQIIGPAPVTCNVTACDEAEPSHADIPWPATLMEFGGATALQTTLCIRGITPTEGGSFTTCTIYIPYVESPNHTYTFTTLPFGAREPGPWSSRCSQSALVSLSGQWTVHGTGLEINH